MNKPIEKHKTQVCYFYKDFEVALSRLYYLGGKNRKKFDKVMSIYGGINQEGLLYLDKMKFTKNGESRIKSCLKIDLGNGYRLVIQKSNNYVAFMYVGNHDQVQKWLDKNQGIEFSQDKEDKTIVPIYRSNEENSRKPHFPTKPSTLPLIQKLSIDQQSEVLKEVSALTAIEISKLTGIVTEEQIRNACSGISDSEYRSFVMDILASLASDNLENVQNLIDIFFKRVPMIDDLNYSEMVEIPDGENVRMVRIGSDEYDQFMKNFSIQGDHLGWLLFMHPDQKAVVDEDFTGSAQLSGVSGSGKTCIAVRRAARLAFRDNEAIVLLVTLNKSLAGLISRLVDQVIPDEKVRSRVKVSSFFELCQELLADLEPDRTRYHDSITWKTKEHIDEVFREYYRCWTNSDDAKVLRPIHRSLLSQGICSETYLREEFDWVRTALKTNRRGEYADSDKTPRVGRTHPLRFEWRTAILKGLSGWETKMESVGVIDYLGQTTALLKHEDKLTPRFTNVIVDEAQDFGTTELGVLRRLVVDGPNDMFLCGDIAQHILPKHRILTEAGIETSRRRRKIEKNYRNTRQILEAAYHVIYQNIHEEMVDRSEKDLEFLDPRYANRSSNEPLVLKAASLEEEVLFARSVVTTQLENHPASRCCIIFAGFTSCEVERFAAKQGVRALDGSANFLDENLVYSDLEQTKGYEFDLVVIVNCREGILPPVGAPDDEVYRDGCRLYVAMTRAKNDLYLSYHDNPSTWLSDAKDKLSFDNWSEVEEINLDIESSVPEKIKEFEYGAKEKYDELTGEQFCLTSSAIGLSLEAQGKICDLVDGRGMIRNRKRVKWRNMGSFVNDLERDGRVKALVGRGKTEKEILSHILALGFPFTEAY